MRHINDFIEKRAVKVYKLNDFKTEFGLFVAIVIAFKVGISIFSGYAGYYYCFNLFINILHNKQVTIISAIIALLFAEYLTNYTLSKFFKFSLRGQLKSAIGLILLSLLFYSGSFYVSTNGLEQREGERVDNTVDIIEKYDFQISELKKGAENSKFDNKKAIETIKANPSGWRSGKRDVLQPNQMDQINTYYSSNQLIDSTLRNDLNILESKKTEELKANSSNVQIIQAKYYNTGVVIMILQFIFNGIIMFFFSRIYYDKHKEQLAKDTVKTFAAQITDTTYELIKQNVIKQALNFQSALSFQVTEMNNTQSLPESLPVNQNKTIKIGFKNTDDDPLNNDSVGTNETDHKTNGTNVFATNETDLKKEIRTCKQCGESFKPYNIKHLFCGDPCRMKWHKTNNGFDLGTFVKHK